ncbi:uncharacterized protein J3R85_004783 [Psidium guajava]|nr:uncharacterized protein J3R85_004783 [Psidium guajava]
MDAITRKKPVLKLVHPGGITEKHRKAITAAEVMKRNPRHFVTRPDVFKYPWIVVRPESLLEPGDVFYVVPFHTVRGLLRCKARQSQQQSPGSCASDEDYENERACESFRLGSCPCDSSSERTKIVKRRPPNVCRESERCRLGECDAGNLTSSKKHYLDQWDETLQQQQQGHDSPSHERNKASFRHRQCQRLLEELCTYDSSNKATHTHRLLKRRSPEARQIMASYKLEGYVKSNRRSVHPVGHHRSLLLTPPKQHLDLFVEKNSPDSTNFQTRVTSEDSLSPAKLSRPESTGGDYYPLLERQSSNACLNVRSPKLGEPDSGIFGCQSEGTPFKEQYLEKHRKSSSFIFWPQSEADGPAGDSEGWHGSSPEEDRFHWLLKHQPPVSCRDVDSPRYGDPRMGNERYFDVLIDGKVSVGDRQNMQGRSDGAEVTNLAWAGSVQDDPHSRSDDKGNRIFQRGTPEMKLDQPQDDVFKLKSCIKKNKNKLAGRRVRFNIPGQYDKNLRVEVFEFQDEETLSFGSSL